MVRLWSEEVGDAKSAIEPIVKEVDPEVDVIIDGGGDSFERETVEVLLKKGESEATLVVTFEAWANARNDPNDMKAAVRRIMDAFGAGSAPGVYLLTTKGLAIESPTRTNEQLRDIAAGMEADVQAERVLGPLTKA